ncbi:MAG: methylenetetrahydrofolate reductase C-terminal domain-containing protein [Anaerolineae bacterium]
MTLRMKEARRWPGSEWIKDHPRPLEIAYRLTRRVVGRVVPWMLRVSPRASEELMIAGEKVAKGYLFNCQMCGQCVLHSTGMTCPMNCPKKLRNGPCGGVRQNGNCEVIEERRCVWVQAWERAHRGSYAEELLILQPPVDQRLQNSSAWLNMVTGADSQPPQGWVMATEDTQATASRSAK